MKLKKKKDRKVRHYFPRLKYVYVFTSLYSKRPNKFTCIQKHVIHCAGNYCKKEAL